MQLYCKNHYLKPGGQLFKLCNEVDLVLRREIWHACVKGEYPCVILKVREEIGVQTTLGGVHECITLHLLSSPDESFTCCLKSDLGLMLSLHNRLNVGLALLLGSDSGFLGTLYQPEE